MNQLMKDMIEIRLILRNFVEYKDCHQDSIDRFIIVNSSNFIHRISRNFKHFTKYFVLQQTKCEPVTRFNEFRLSIIVCSNNLIAQQSLDCYV